jgi:hypothetical protein
MPSEGPMQVRTLILSVRRADISIGVHGDDAHERQQGKQQRAVGHGGGKVCLGRDFHNRHSSKMQKPSGSETPAARKIF